MKIRLNGIKNNLQGINSRVDEAENQITDLEHKEAKNNHTGNKKKKEPPQNEVSIAASGTTSNIPTFESQGC